MRCEHKSFLWVALGVALGLGILYLWSWRRRKLLLQQFASAALLKGLMASFSPLRLWVQWALPALAIVLLFVALARPQWGHVLSETKTKGVDVLMALDVSKSMLAQDIKPDRLQRAKLAIWDFVKKLEGDPVGLIIFAGQAFLTCPLTADYEAFRQSLESVDVDLIEAQGTDLAIAIQEAQSLLHQEENFKRLVLITDGEDLEEKGFIAASKAAEEGLVIYTVGVGTPTGELIPIRDAQGKPDYLRDASGKPVQTRLDPTTLERIAAATGGFYTPLGALGEGLDRVYQEGLGSIPKRERQGQMLRIPIERFEYFLWAALGLLLAQSLITTRRKR